VCVIKIIVILMYSIIKYYRCMHIFLNNKMFVVHTYLYAYCIKKYIHLYLALMILGMHTHRQVQ